MTDENQRLDRLDSLIDGALYSYTPQEARPGLEQRVMASIASAAGVSRLRPWNWRLAWMSAATVVLLAAVAILLVYQPSRPGVAVVNRPPVAAARHATQAAVPALTPAQHTRASHLSTSPAQFEELGGATRPSLGPIEPLTIAPLRDKPLTEEAIGLKPIAIAPIRIAVLN